MEAKPVSDVRGESPGAGTLERLMVRYQCADREAAAQLVEGLSPMLARFLARPGVDRAHMEDLLQDCWIRIHKARHTYRPGSPLLPWVFAIARHTRLDDYRRRSRFKSREVALDDVHLDTIGRRDSHSDLLDLLDRLPESQREVLLMLKVSGMSIEEVARATSTTAGAVKQKAHRAYEKLRALLAESSI